MTERQDDASATSVHSDTTPREVGGLARPEFIAIIALMMALNALAIDIMLPAFPNMIASFALAAPNDIQFVILTYVSAFGLAQLVFGPVSDRFGRRAPLFFGIALYICSAIAGALAPDFTFLLVARFVQGVGAAATRVVALSVVRDTQAGRAMASTMSLVMMVFMVVPIFAPLTGQALIMIGEWHMIFLFMALLAAVVGAWSWLRLPETLQPERRRPLTVGSITSAFQLVFSFRQSTFYTLAVAFYFGGLFAFINLAQPIYVDIYGLGSSFPIAFSAIAGFMAVASYTNSRLVVRLGQRRISHAALIGYFSLALLLAGLAWHGPLPFWMFFAIMALMMPLFGFVGANFNSLAMEPLGAVAGTASAVLGFTQTAGGSLIGTLISQQYQGTILPLATGFAVVSGISLAMVLIAEKGRLFSAHPQAAPPH